MNLQIQFKKYLARQFSIAFDVYLAIRAEVDRRVKDSLGRQSGDWRLRHTCPACTYKLCDEIHLRFSMLWAMDGNDSLKRILRRTQNPETGENDGPSRERMDSRTVPGDMYLSRDEVNKWAKEVVQEMKNLGEEVCLPSWFERAAWLTAPQEGASYNPCTERWKNMKEELTNRVWGLFDETGVFMGFCRHGFTLMITDMVRSGEQYVLFFIHAHPTASDPTLGLNTHWPASRKCSTLSAKILEVASTLVATWRPHSTTAHSVLLHGLLTTNPWLMDSTGMPTRVCVSYLIWLHTPTAWALRTWGCVNGHILGPIPSEVRHGI